MKKKNLAAMLICTVFIAALVFPACEEMEVAPPGRVQPIVRPHISVQPASASYHTTDTVRDLFAQVWDWKAEDGKLSYCWYSFDSMADFIASGGTPEGEFITIDPETDATVSPAGINVIDLQFPLTGISKTANTIKYYYVEIKNANSKATDRKEWTTRSEIAAIAFSAPGSALFPQITKNPASASYKFGRFLVMMDLSVKAAAPDDGDLTYQWYYNTTGSILPADLEEIEGATSATYSPSVTEIETGKNYFFVEVTNDTGSGTPAKLLSVPSLINMEAGDTALEPVITKHPEDALYFTADTVVPLTVETEPSMDGGRISYQWYSNSSPTTRGASSISGATGASYTPPKTSGTKYYYVRVINTNPGVKSSTKTATTNSNVVRIVVTTPLNGAEPKSVISTRDPRLPGNRYQYIRGYGGTDVVWANFPEQKPADTELLHNPDWGLGLNMSRIMISPANTNINITMRDLINTHRPNFYENVKIVNKYGGYVSASPWSPPKEWKSNNSINGGGYLIYIYRQQFANYLRDFAKHMYDAGAPIFAVSISNEPNYAAGYDGCEWSPEEMRDFFKVVNPKPFTTGIRGYGGGKETPRVWVLNGESANTPYINIAALADPVSRANIDVYGRHVYGSATQTLWRIPADATDSRNPTTLGSGVTNFSTINNILRRPDGTFYEVWMTEHNINSANATAYPNDSTWNYLWRFMNDVDVVMRLNNENAFVWWASKRFYSLIGDGQFGTRDGAALPRGIGLSHYAKYTIDTHRLNFSMTGTLNNGTNLGIVGGANTIVNATSFNLDNEAVRITAYVSLESGKDNKPIRAFDNARPEDVADWSDVNFISYVMWTPTKTNGSGGRDMGMIEIQMPDGFVIGGVSAHKSTSASNTMRPETVQVNAAKTSAYVTLGPGQILSVKLTRQK
jgi:O-glycosyl hydrolase